MGGSLAFLLLTWQIPSVASAMMAGAVHLSVADVNARHYSLSHTFMKVLLS